MWQALGGQAQARVLRSQSLLLIALLVGLVQSAALAFVSQAGVERRQQARRARRKGLRTNALLLLCLPASAQIKPHGFAVLKGLWLGPLTGSIHGDAADAV